MADLLLELFSEEIPAGMQARASADLERMLLEALSKSGLSHGAAESHVTPRRLTLILRDVADESPAVSTERKGPRADAPEAALEGFLRSTGLSREQLELRDDKKGQVYFARIETPGRSASEIIAEVVPEIVRGFPWPKSMRWGSGSLRWVRPLTSILCLLDGKEVDFEVEGFASGDTTEGHRFMAPGRFSVGSVEDYKAKLKSAHVVLAASDRAEEIWRGATDLAQAAGLEVVEDSALLTEVAGLVEWPVPLLGKIDAQFLDLPGEVLQTSMREHQKFFSARDPKTGRIEGFVTVANRETADAGATILAGNGRVLTARLADAAFFWENDLRVARDGMKDWLQALENVTFHAKLGSVADRVRRIADLSRALAPTLGADPDQVARAADLAKADLASEMVYEFAELQGVMGRYYAEAAGEPSEIAAVAEEHYKPLGPSDDVPSAPLSATVALAEKLDALTGFWSIDEKPTGSKDPFALRRAALGVIRILLENNLRLDLAVHTGAGVIGFIHDRLKVYLRGEGLRHDVIDAVLSMPGSDDLTYVVDRARALQAFLDTPDGENLVQGFKRAANILAQAEAEDGVEYRYGADAKYADADAEKELFSALEHIGGRVNQALETNNFSAALGELATLRAAIDGFFDAVQVNADAQILRRNRLNLLYEITQLCDRIADLRRLAG
ncbi:MAG: glycine--tRNA ligase subunit beta [Pseudomonadota bacterium]